MKKTLIGCLCFIFLSCSYGSLNKSAQIHFFYSEYNFGKLFENQEVEYIFEFTNPGETPVIISNVETSCGCTAADWTKEPVKPGKSGQIMIKYDADFPGTFSKTITVHYNGKDSPAILTIKGQVAYPEDVEGPKE
jgi:hypothetical protein